MRILHALLNKLCLVSHFNEISSVRNVIEWSNVFKRRRVFPAPDHVVVNHENIVSSDLGSWTNISKHKRPSEVDVEEQSGDELSLKWIAVQKYRSVQRHYMIPISHAIAKSNSDNPDSMTMLSWISPGQKSIASSVTRTSSCTNSKQCAQAIEIDLQDNVSGIDVTFSVVKSRLISLKRLSHKSCITRHRSQ